MTTTHFVWDRLSDNVLGEYDAAGDPIAQYTNEPGQFGELVSQHRGGDTSTYHYDGLGNTRQLTDENQNVTDEYTFSAFGEEVAKTGSSVNPFGFRGALGYYANPRSDEIYALTRTYQPATGRWLSPSQRERSNAYVYADNQPAGNMASTPPTRTHRTVVKRVPCQRDCLPVFGNNCTFRVTSTGLYFGTAGNPPTVKDWSLRMATSPGLIPHAALLLRGTVDSLKAIYGDAWYCAWSRMCFSDFDRTANRSSYIRVELLNGLFCDFTAANFGGTSPRPNTLPAHCRGILEFEPTIISGTPSGRFRGGTYRLTTEVASVSYSFEIAVHCGCFLLREQNLNPRNQTTISISGSIPGDPADPGIEY